jgi:protein TonB
MPELSGGAHSPGANASAAPTVYFVADEMPQFPGGSAAMLKFMGSRLNYPTAALDRNVSGKVYVTFTVDPEGRLHDPHVVRGLGSGLDEEALRLVRLMPWWNPGKLKGQPVWVALTLPITFRAL